jgi:hypothetical protein
MKPTDSPIGQLEHALRTENDDALIDFVREDVLYRSFTEREIEYYTSTGIEYDRTLVRPARLEDRLWARVRPAMMGTNLRVGSSYTTQAPLDRTNMTSFDPFDGTHVAVAVCFRADVSVDEYGVLVDPSVLVTRLDD